MNRVHFTIIPTILCTHLLAGQIMGRGTEFPNGPAITTEMVISGSHEATVQPRSIMLQTEVDSQTFVVTDTLQGDRGRARPRLLPENISFMEKALWGENGVIRSIGIASPLSPEVRKHELAVRRTMLTAHQIGGFVTLGSMIATVYSGQKYLNSGQRSDRSLHQTFIPITIACYTTTGLLSVLSPPPMIRRDDETSTTSIHKTLAWIHFAGMIATPLLGKAISKRGSSYYDQAKVHQISAYITTTVFAASMIVITF
jgi:hypothetical protein